MSTGLNCEVVERRPHEWYYVLEHYSAPKMAWDWRDYATAYGPFETKDAAMDDLHNLHANPGSHVVIPNEQYVEDERYKQLFDNAM